MATTAVFQRSLQIKDSTFNERNPKGLSGCDATEFGWYNYMICPSLGVGSAIYSQHACLRVARHHEQVIIESWAPSSPVQMAMHNRFSVHAGKMHHERTQYVRAASSDSRDFGIAHETSE
jgi:hypothetical protein